MNMIILEIFFDWQLIQACITFILIYPTRSTFFL